MWTYHNVTRAYAGVLTGELPVDHSITDVEPPTHPLGERLIFGYDGKWQLHGIYPVSRAEGRLALHRAGLLEQAEAILAQADIEARIWYADAQHWERSHPVVVTMGQALGLTPEQIDQLFLSA